MKAQHTAETSRQSLEYILKREHKRQRTKRDIMHQWRLTQLTIGYDYSLSFAKVVGSHPERTVCSANMIVIMDNY
jgi:hypothetical protein